ncbi:PqqD family protein [Telmatobacter bradus]|uniref:PqqD family protein n=1 Tax=Telmatobacter bradus TaxID=474953 RepID=UPI003B437C6B
MRNSSTHLRTIANQDGAVILNSAAGTITTLNSTGAFVWQALERGENQDAIVADLARETGEQVDTLKRDVQKFIDALKNQHLLFC